MPNIKTVLLLSACTVSLSACATARDYNIPENPDGTAQIELTAENPEHYQAAEPVISWWHEFNDPQLGALVEQSLSTNLNIRIAIANLFEARSVARQAGFDRFPTVTTDAVYNRQRLSEEGVGGAPADRSVNNYDAGFDASWELDLFGRVSQRIGAQEALHEASAADLQDVFVTISSEVARTYIELRGAQYRLNIAQRNAGNQKKTYELTQTLSNGGRATALDVSRAKTQLALTQATIPPLQAEISATIRRLSVLTGQVPDALRTMLSDIKPLPSLPISVAVGNATALLKRRPDIRRAERDLAASVARYNLAVTNLFPTVNLMGSLGFLATNLGSFGSSALTGVIGPSLNWRAFDLGRVRAEIDQSDAQSMAALAVYEKTVLESLEETQTALSDFKREEERRAKLQDAARSAKESADLAKLRFNKGVDGFLDVLDAERTLLEAEDALAISETTAAIDLITIYKALGGGWETHYSP